MVKKKTRVYGRENLDRNKTTLPKTRDEIKRKKKKLKGNYQTTRTRKGPWRNASSLKNARLALSFNKKGRRRNAYEG